MHRLLFMLLFGPFWLQLAFAGGLLALGFVFQSSEAARIAAGAALLKSDPPPTISIAAMREDYIPDGATEVSVTAQIALSHNTRLVRTTYAIKTTEDLLYVLVDPDAPQGTNIARAAIVFDPDDLDRVTGWIAENTVTFASDGPVLPVTGLLSGGTQIGMVSDALSDQGMTKGPDFFYITPHFEGRVAALTPNPMRPSFTLCGSMPLRRPFCCLGPSGLPAAVYQCRTPMPPPLMLIQLLPASPGNRLQIV